MSKRGQTHWAPWPPQVEFNFAEATEEQKRIFEQENKHCAKFFGRSLPHYQREETGWLYSWLYPSEIRVD